MNLPILTLLVALPLIGGVAVLLTGRARPSLARWVALGASLVTFVVSLLLWGGFDPTSADYQFVERYSWLPDFGISYHVGVDGISLLLVVLTTFLTPIALLTSIRGMFVDSPKWFALGGFLISGGLAAVIAVSTLKG